MKKRVVMTALTLLLLSSLSVASQSVPRTIRDLIILGLETNLNLKIDQIETVKGFEEVNIEAGVFDSNIFATTGFGKDSIPYDSSLGHSSNLDTETLSGQFGLTKRFKTGLNATLSLSSEWEEGDDLSTNLDPRYRTTLSLALTQPLLRDFGTAVNTTFLEVSRNQSQQISLDFLLKTQGLILQLESVSRQLAAKDKIIELRREALDLARELYRANQKRFASGVIPVTEVQEAETALSARQLDLSLAIQDRDLLFETLNRHLNHSLSAKFKPVNLVQFKNVIPDTRFHNSDLLLSSALRNRLELKMNNYAIQNSSLQHDYYYNQLKPRLDLKVKAGVTGLSGDAGKIPSSYSGSWGDSLAGLGDADGFQWYTGLEFSVPLGNRSARARYRQAELRLKQDHYKQNDLEAMIRSDVLQQQANVSFAEKQLVITRRLEDLAVKTLHQEQRRLDEGLSDTFRMIIFQQKMIEAKIARINAITRYHLACAQLEFALGNTFSRHNIILVNRGEELSIENI